ncbi:UDP-3-O-(3-hydroxymyristoyl)glucosamine N-acyltransferase [Cohnella sp. CIP 111063]|uniref:acyltransferase n=1 Tax=unclassified Cohnella TaxID=2636738 RepID=UPI000B8BBF6F|nr:MULTISPECIES: N-acetyltransferase [unclassified Cohnella]OXS55919.1 UDP-3-O-(3-hydroxymyristoyl)glucosamine N-acyltransferase [Cohnella sp. CIP 111063]PRX67123.1 transferase family hexapeptide repeat protein [Cohnella sp. SGD-V74]
MANYIHPDTFIGENVTFGYNCIVEAGVRIENNVTIGHNVIIYADTAIGEGSIIHDNVVIGKKPMRAARSIMKEQKHYEPAVIGARVTIGTNAVIYAQSKLEDEVFVADLATVRENVSIGKQTIIGRNVAVENESTVGAYCKIETNAYITAFSTIEDYVFVAPGVVTSNDNFIGRTEKRFAEFKGCTIRRGGRVAANATLLPGVVVEPEAVVGAGSVARKTLKSGIIYVGNPARELRAVDPEQQLSESE